MKLFERGAGRRENPPSPTCAAMPAWRNAISSDSFKPRAIFNLRVPDAWTAPWRYASSTGSSAASPPSKRGCEFFGDGSANMAPATQRAPSGAFRNGVETSHRIPSVTARAHASDVLVLVAFGFTHREYSFFIENLAGIVVTDDVMPVPPATWCSPECHFPPNRLSRRGPLDQRGRAVPTPRGAKQVPSRARDNPGL